MGEHASWTVTVQCLAESLLISVIFCTLNIIVWLYFRSSTVTSQRPSSHGSSTSTSLHLALSTTTTMSHPMTPTFGHAHHSSLFPHFPSFHPHPGALGYSHGPAGESPFPYPSNALGIQTQAPHHLTPPPLSTEGQIELWRGGWCGSLGWIKHFCEGGD